MARMTSLAHRWIWPAVLVVGLWLIYGHQADAQTGAASLKISPSTGQFEVGSLVDISFLVDTGGDSVNAINADILFPADKLQVVNPAASTSFITIWVTAPKYSNTDGTISFQGGLPNPGIKTSSGVISTVTFRVKSAGRAVLRYAPTSQVLRNDGEGTNILTATSTAELILKNPPPAGPVVSSPSHPDSNTWYNNRTVQFSWEAAEGATGYSFTFDQNSKSTPDEVSDVTTTSLQQVAEGDGIWYFHLRAKTDIWGGTTTFAVRIDNSPPATFSPEIDHDTITVEETALLRFITTDAASGIDHYEVKYISRGGQGQSNTLFIEASSPYTVQPLQEGQYEFIVRAIDRAGNTSEGSTELNVVAAGLSFFARVPLLRNPAVANAALLLLAGLVVVMIAGITLRRFRIRTAFRQDLAALERDARKKSAALQQELDEIRRAEAIMHTNLGLNTPPTQSPPLVPPQPPRPI